MEKTGVFIFILILIAVATYFFISSLKEEIKKEPGMPEEREGISVEEVKIIREDEERGFSIDVSYPRILGMKDQEKQERVNQVIASMIERSIPVFEESKDGFEQKSSFSVDYSVQYISEELLSIRFNQSIYVAGASHPNDYAVAFNYDLVGEKEIMLSDIFKDDSGYLEVISTYCINDILAGLLEEERQSLEDQVRIGAGPEEDNFSAFVFNDKSLIFIFNPYQVGPYAMGFFEVEMPLEGLEGIIDSEGPLASFL